MGLTKGDTGSLDLVTSCTPRYIIVQFGKEMLLGVGGGEGCGA